MEISCETTVTILVTEADAKIEGIFFKYLISMETPIHSISLNLDMILSYGNSKIVDPFATGQHEKQLDDGENRENRNHTSAGPMGNMRVKKYCKKNQVVMPIKKQVGFDAPTSCYIPHTDSRHKSNFLYQYIIQDPGRNLISSKSSMKDSSPSKHLLLFTPPTADEKKFVENRINQENSVKESFHFQRRKGCNAVAPSANPLTPKST